jgi:zinc transport system substrate-binding protein
MQLEEKMKNYKTVNKYMILKIFRFEFKAGLKVVVSLIMILVLLTGTTACAQSPEEGADEKLRVVASFYPMYDFALKIGGEQINLKNLVPGGAEPHSWEPEAADLISLEQADVFIYNGAGMEHWVEPVLAALQNKELIVVETTAELDLIAGHDHESDDSDHKEGSDADQAGEVDEHENEEFDPHVWLDPMLAKQQMNSIKEALIKADPDNTEYYKDNYDRTAVQLDELDREYHEALANVTGRDIIVAHAAYGYLAEAYDLNQIAISGLSPEQEPDPARMAEIIEFAEKSNIKVIFFEELVSPKVAETIAEATGAETAVLSPLGGLTEQQLAQGEDYFTVMRRNLEALKSALD